MADYPPHYGMPPPPHMIHHPPAHHFEPSIDWVQATPDSTSFLQDRAFVAGQDSYDAWYDNGPLWVIRAYHNGECVPGKFSVNHGIAYIPYDGQEVQMTNFEVLCTHPEAVQWSHCSDGQIPPGAIPAGNTAGGEPLYIARVPHEGSVTPGKVHPSHGCCYIPYGGREIQFNSYEVLCQLA